MKLTEKISMRLDVMFNAFREREGIKKGQVCSEIDPITEYGILMNRRFKEENDIELSSLEERVASEEGMFIRMYIADLFYELGIDKLQRIPFPEYDISLELSDNIKM